MSALYEQGESVAKVRVLGRSNFLKTYAYVADECDNIDKAFSEMLNYISTTVNEKVIKVDEINLRATVSGGVEYTLCHELVNGKKNFKKPCNIIRYVSLKVYTKDSLYVDENGEVIDVTHRAISDISNSCNGFVQGFTETITNHPDVIPEILLSWLGYFSCDISSDISRNIKDIPESTPCFDITTPSAKKLLEFKIVLSLINNLSESSMTYKYLTKRCGLTLNCSFNPSTEPLPKPHKYSKEKSLKTSPLDHLTNLRTQFVNINDFYPSGSPSYMAPPSPIPYDDNTMDTSLADIVESRSAYKKVKEEETDNTKMSYDDYKMLMTDAVIKEIEPAQLPSYFIKRTRK